MRVAPGVVLACAVGVCAAPPIDRAARATQTGSNTAREVTEGRLQTQVGKKLIDVPLKHTDVDIRITGFLANVEVEQTFQNPYDKKIEAVYLFPLPTGAAVNQMEIQIGERRVTGVIKKRAEAKRIYRRARRQGHVAALLTQERPNLFTQHVANIEPGHEVMVRLQYVQVLDYEAGGYEVVFPMVAPPRYQPDPSSPEAKAVQSKVLPPDLRSSHDISLAVELDAGVPITNIKSPSHRIDVSITDGRRAAIKIAADDTIPNQDFILHYRVAGAMPELAVLSHRDRADGSFFLLAQPPAQVASATISPRELIFVVDSSSSMTGLPLAKAKAVIRRALAGMQPDDTFQIVRFDDSASGLGPALINNKPKNLEYALGWLDQLEAGGTTEMIGGIEAALAFPQDPARLRIVVFLTDGYIGNEDQVLAAMVEKIGSARLFSFGVGTAVNRYLLEEMAAIGRGAVTVVRPDEETKTAVDRFYRRIDRPLLTNIRIDWNGLEVSEVTPALIPDLFAGQPLVLSGHYRQPGTATITVHGRLGGREVTFEAPASFPEHSPARPEIATVWARRRIAELARKRIRGETPELEKQITELALSHSLMSRYTAFVAVDTSSVTKGGAAHKVQVPVEVPRHMRAYGRAPATDPAIGGWSQPRSVSYSLKAHDDAYDMDGDFGGAVPAGEHKISPKAPIRRSEPAPVARSPRPDVDNSKRRGLKRCYEQRLKSVPDLAGRVTLALLVDKTGAVTVVRLVRSTIEDAELNSCLSARVKLWKFNPRDQETTIHVPLVFTR